MRATTPLVLTAALGVGLLAGCGGTADDVAAEVADGDASEQETAGGDGTAAEATTGATGATDAADAADGGELTPVGIAVSPAITSIPVYLADELGYFAEEGLDADLQVLQSGAQTIPALLNGDLQFAVSDTVATISAVANDVPLQIISTNILGPEEGQDDFVGVVSADVAEGDAAGLVGRSLAVNQLRGAQELLSRASLEALGVDPEGVQFVEVPPPDMQTAVEEGRVDAAYVLEPFYTSSLNAGLETVMEPGVVSAGLPLVTFATSQEFAGSDPETVAAFNRAIARATTYAAENPDDARATAAGYTGLPPEVTDAMRLPAFAPDALDTSRVGELADLMVEQGFLETAPDLEAYVGAEAG